MLSCITTNNSLGEAIPVGKNTGEAMTVISNVDGSTRSSNDTSVDRCAVPLGPIELEKVLNVEVSAGKNVTLGPSVSTNLSEMDTNKPCGVTEIRDGVLESTVEIT